MNRETRSLMVAEIEHDVASGTTYFGKRLNQAGHEQWIDLFRRAATEFDDDWLAIQLRERRLMRETETYTRSGVERQKAVPHTAATTFAECEFNRFYIRALCMKAIAEGVPAVIVYRAKEVQHARPESEAKLTAEIDPKILLEDLRENREETESGFPGPNSGLSVRFP